MQRKGTAWGGGSTDGGAGKRTSTIARCGNEVNGSFQLRWGIGLWELPSIKKDKLRTAAESIGRLSFGRASNCEGGVHEYCWGKVR